MKNMLNFKEFTADELMDILNLALDMKKNPEKYSESLKGKKLYTLFEKTSTRTFLSFATGITELGGTYYNQLWKDSNFVLGEPVSEIKYVCRNVDIIMARLIKNETVELFGKNATVPFINGCDNSYHPCQILADALTILEKFGTLDVNLMYIGAKNNVFNSHVEFFSKMKKGTLYGLTPLVNETACGPDFYEEAKKSGYMGRYGILQQSCLSEAKGRNPCKDDALPVKRRLHKRQQSDRIPRYANACRLRNLSGCRR